MNRIDTAFRTLRTQRRAALIPFLVLGDPDMGTTRELMHAAVDSGADLLELGVPFSDPTADGPVLQRSAEIAIRAGASLGRALELVADFRSRSDVPVVLYGYYNPIFHYGPERFAADAHAAGIDGALVVDLPPEDADELLVWTRPAGVHLIFLLTPTSGPDRVRKVLRHAGGFVYYVSVTGVTGVRPILIDTVRPAVQSLQRATRLPIGVGFGISTPDQAHAVATFADAVIVGTAIMRIIETHRGSREMVAEVSTFIHQLKRGMEIDRHSDGAEEHSL